MNIHEKTGFQEAVLASILIALITIVLPEYFPQLFVYPTGQITIFGKDLGIVFSVGMVLGWRWLRPVLSLSFGFSFLFSLWWMAIHPEFLPGTTLLALLQLGLISLLLHSQNLKTYLEN